MNQTAIPNNPLRILITALGGEGGGVLMNWIVEAARLDGRPVQATSVPGVAQRTGATSYYLEILPPGVAQQGTPLSLMPMAGRVDVVIASELVEAARAMERGFVSPRLTTLIASTNRVYATAEKIEMGDGRFDEEQVKKAAQALAKRVHLLDLAAMAEQHGTFISATMFGGLAGSGVLPWSPEISVRALGSGRAAEASKAGFDAAFELVSRGGDNGSDTSSTATVDNSSSSLVKPPGIHAEAAPGELRDLIARGYNRVIDFQDQAYGEEFVDRSNRLLTNADMSNPIVIHALTEAIRRLALWMTYEDVARVADLKTRPKRFAEVAKEVQLEPGQILHVTEYLKPGAEEVAAMLPVGLGRWMMKRAERGGSFPFLGRGIHLRSTGVFGFCILRLIAGLKRMRRRSLRFAEEQAAIEEWMAALTGSLQRSPSFAAALAELPRVLKGYSETQARGQRAYRMIMDQVVQPVIETGEEDLAASRLRQAVAAALAAPDHSALDTMLDDRQPAEFGAGSPAGSGTPPQEKSYAH